MQTPRRSPQLREVRALVPLGPVLQEEGRKPTFGDWKFPHDVVDPCGPLRDWKAHARSQTQHATIVTPANSADAAAGPTRLPPLVPHPHRGLSGSSPYFWQPQGPASTQNFLHTPDATRDPEPNCAKPMVPSQALLLAMARRHLPRLDASPLASAQAEVCSPVGHIPALVPSMSTGGPRIDRFLPRPPSLPPPGQIRHGQGSLTDRTLRSPRKPRPTGSQSARSKAMNLAHEARQALPPPSEEEVVSKAPDTTVGHEASLMSTLNTPEDRALAVRRILLPQTMQHKKAKPKRRANCNPDAEQTDHKETRDACHESASPSTQVSSFATQHLIKRLDKALDIGAKGDESGGKEGGRFMTWLETPSDDNVEDAVSLGRLPLWRKHDQPAGETGMISSRVQRDRWGPIKLQSPPPIDFGTNAVREQQKTFDSIRSSLAALGAQRCELRELRQNMHAVMRVGVSNCTAAGQKK